MRLLPLLLPLAGLATARVLDSWTIRALTHGNDPVTDVSGVSGAQMAEEAGGVDDDGMRKVVDNVRRWVVKGAGEGARMVEGVRRKGQGVKEENIWEKAAARRDQKEWQILELTRYPNQQENTTTWQFTIVDDAGKKTSCSLPSPTSDPSASFYGIPCGADASANYKISWGYNSDADSAVMTVCYVPNGTDAWFGYDKVSTIQLLGDSKKEPVYYTGCA